MKNKEGLIKVRPYTVTELASLYEVDVRTMRNWLNKFKDKMGEKVGRYYSIPQVKIIFDKLNVPHYINPDEKENGD